MADPTPTSSFDAPVAADSHLTVNDKIALAVGLPIILIAISTLGYWRAVKFFVHRKVTGEPKLPTYGSYNPGDRDVSGGFSIRSSFSSRPPSLWGAASTRGSIVPDGFGYGDTELLAPRGVGPRPPADPSRPSSASSNLGFGGVRSSNLRQEWHAV
jgi:hypothetical protein